jgi:ubiquinone/menaquinone biosynthesis C-methylase UbiE
MDPKSRFSNRVDDYVRYRPTYPTEVLRVLENDAGLTSAAVIADIGSGTGISAKLFLEHGNTVYGVEPNLEMRAAAEKILDGNAKFHSIDGSAEQTTLPDGSVDFVVAGQTFHWFDQPKARKEFSRVLKPGGWVVLMWNSRRTGNTPFLCDYEGLLREFATDYTQVGHRLVDDSVIGQFFSPEAYIFRSLPNSQSLDRPGLIGRIASSSYMPAEGHPSHAAMLSAVEKLFERNQQGGRVKIEYDTVVYFGHLA